MQIFQEQKPVQQQRPQMYAAVEILQLDVCQLQSYISTALLENPTFECGAAPAVSLLDDLPAGRRGTGEDAEGLPQPDLADKDAVAYGGPDDPPALPGRTAFVGADHAARRFCRDPRARPRRLSARRSFFVWHGADF